MERARESRIGFAVFDEEPDSGAVAHALGDAAYLEKLVEKNLETLECCGVHEIVATSPYDYDVFQRIYPKYGDSFRVFHATEFLDQLLQISEAAREFTALPEVRPAELLAAKRGGRVFLGPGPRGKNPRFGDCAYPPGRHLSV